MNELCRTCERVIDKPRFLKYKFRISFQNIIHFAEVQLKSVICVYCSILILLQRHLRMSFDDSTFQRIL